MKLNVNILRRAIIDLLDCDEGVCVAGYDSLRSFVSSLGTDIDSQCDDIWVAVRALGEVFYLPENHGLE